MHGVASVRPTVRRAGELKKKTGVPKGAGHLIATPTALLKEDSAPPFVAARITTDYRRAAHVGVLRAARQAG